MKEAEGDILTLSKAKYPLLHHGRLEHPLAVPTSAEKARGCLYARKETDEILRRLHGMVRERRPLIAVHVPVKQPKSLKQCANLTADSCQFISSGLV